MSPSQICTRYVGCLPTAPHRHPARRRVAFMMFWSDGWVTRIV